MIGSQIGSYEITGELGRGGMGVVYRAIQPLLKREVTIKVILPEFANRADFIRRFEIEAELVAKLEHPFIVPLYDYWREPNGAFLVMRFLRGGTLRQALQKGPWDLTKTARLIDQIASALHTAHRKSIVHRDLKPDNILLDDDGNAYLTDFGIAKTTLEDRITEQNTMLGSPGYLSPEQITGGVIGPFSDIYSLGIVLFEIIAGVQPFADVTPTELLFRHLQVALPLLEEYRPGLPAEANEVIQRATAKDPTKRYLTALDLAQDFRKVAGKIEPLSESEPDKTWEDIIIRFIPLDTDTLLKGTALEIPNPFKGLRPFAEGDAIDFFGRTGLVNQLLETLQREGPYQRFLAVVGPSGCGKSSVIFAGLLPRLRQGAIAGSQHWFYVVMTPSANPIGQLTAALLKIATKPPAMLDEQLQTSDRGLVWAVDRVLGDNDGEMLLVIDQFEELFTLVQDEQERVRFLNLLRVAAEESRSRLRIIVTLRADFFDRPLQYKDFGEMIRQRNQLVLPLTSDELEESIVGPVRRLGLDVETGLVAAIIGDIQAEPGGLPLVQYTLTELFERRSGPHLTSTTYRNSGGVLGALASRAEEVFLDLPETQQELARQILLRLVTLGEGTEDTRRRVHRSELAHLGEPDEVAAVLEAFGKYRLLTFDYELGSREPTAEVAHEALIRSWERFREWINDSREDLRIHRRLSGSVQEWQAANREPSFLVSGNRLDQFDTWSKSTNLVLDPVEREYLAASKRERDIQETKERTRVLKEAKLQKRAANLQHYLIAVLAIFLVGALLLSMFAFNREGKAKDSAATSQANEQRFKGLVLAYDAQNLNSNGSSPELSALLSLKSLSEQYNPRGDSALAVSSEFIYSEKILTGDDNILYGVTFSPDGQYVVAASGSGSALMWNIATGELVRQFQGHEGRIYSVDFSADGATLLTAGRDHTVRLWDTTTGEEIRRYEGATDNVNTVAFSPDETHIAAGSEDSMAYVWDTATAELVQSLTGHEQAIWNVAWSNDGAFIYTGSFDSIVRQWDAKTGEVAHTFESMAPVLGIAVSPDSHYVAAGGNDGFVYVWDVTTGEIAYQFDGYSGPIAMIAFSPDGRYLAATRNNNTGTVWEIATGRELYWLVGHTGSLWGVAFSPDGNTIATTSNGDVNLRLWATLPEPHLTKFVGHGGLIRSTAYSSDGKLLLTGSDDWSARVWDTATGQALFELTGQQGAISAVAVSPDGRFGLTGSEDTSLWLWDLSTGHKLQEYKANTGAILTTAFSPDGRYVVAGTSHPNTDEGYVALWLWDRETGELVQSFNSPTNVVYALAFSPDGTQLVTGSPDTSIKLWDVASGELIRQLVGHENAVWDVAFSPDGKQIASASEDNTLRLWDVASGRQIRVFNGHSQLIYSVDFSPNGQLLLSGSADGSARVWNIASGEEIRRIQSGVYGISGLAVRFTPDGQYLLTPENDGSAQLWEVNLQELIDYMCNKLPRDFTADERADYQIEGNAPTCPD